MKITEDALVEQSMNTTFTGIGTYFIATSHYAPQTIEVGRVAGTLLGASFIAIGFTFSAAIASIGE